MARGEHTEVMLFRTGLSDVWGSAVDVALVPIFVLSYLVPRSDRISVYGYSNGSSFTDNSKYQFLYTAGDVADHRAVWLTRDASVLAELRSAGHEVHRFRSVRGVLLTLRAGVVFVTHTRRDVPWWATGGADVVRLGHGIPFKKYGRADPGYRDRKRGLKRVGYELLVANYTHSIATSERYAEYVAAATGLAESAVHVTGIPRMDMPTLEEDERLLYADRRRERTLAEEYTDSQVVFYFPTWRDGDADPVPDDVDFEELDAVLRATDSYLLLRPHINTDDRIVDADELDRVEFLDGGSDFYPLFEHVDLFVTDYSSLFHDSVFYDVPVLFFAHDLQEYTERRAFFFEYRSVPGEIARTSGEFHDSLAAILRDLDRYADRVDEDMEAWREATFAFRNGGNSERVSERFLAS